MQHPFSRRAFLKTTTTAGAVMVYSWQNLFATDARARLETRGVVVTVDDLATLDWPRLANDADLTTIGTHVTPSQVAAFINSKKGQQFLADCSKYNLRVEHELHAMKDLLPRNLFEKNPLLFRMNKEGFRVNDFNCCAHSAEGLDIIADNAVKYARLLPSTTHRYFYWIDDGAPMCYCEQCREYSESEQALLIENAMIKKLRAQISEASLAHLAYITTMKPPQKVKPAEGIFLEFAPIYRSWFRPLKDRSALPDIHKPDNGQVITHGDTLQLLKDNLKVFGAEHAQVLEYWLDVSLQSRWHKPSVKLSFDPTVLQSDVTTYTGLGIKNITTFAAYVNGEYKNRYKDMSFISTYGEILRRMR